MGVTRASLTAVLEDLRLNREKLLDNLGDLDRVIACLERMYRIAPENTEVKEPGAPAEAPDPPKPAPANQLLKSNKRAIIPGIGLAEAIIQAAEESKFNQAQISKRVVELRPGTSQSVAETQVSAMLKDRRLHKGNDLIIRNVVNGKIQGLPVEQNEGESYGSYGQYSS